MMGSSNNLNPAYIFQFTQDESWTCNDHTCLDRCQFDQILFNSLENIKIVSKNHNADNAEAVCELAYSVMKQETTLEQNNNNNCGFTKNEIAILISNSDLHHHVLQPHQGSPCKEHFEGRLAIGTHATDWSDLTEFSSEHFKSFYVSSTL